LYAPIDDPLATTGTNANAINDMGQIVGTYMVAGIQHGFFRSTGGLYTTIDDPLGARGTQAFGINNAGQIVGSYSDSSSKSHGFLYNPNANTYSTLDDPLGTNGTIAFGINKAGQIVGFYTASSSTRHGFLYNPNGGTFITLDDPLATGAGGTDPSGINDAGQVVGFYVENTGRHGFLEIIAPNPPPPGGTTADMILRHGADGFYEIYDIGNNSLLAVPAGSGRDRLAIYQPRRLLRERHHRHALAQ
jgi:probable HAF family extracellular repeat protein